MTIYQLEEMRKIVEPLRDLELKPIEHDGEHIGDLYRGLCRMNKEHTAGIYLLCADDLEHEELIIIKPEIAEFLIKGPDMIRQLLSLVKAYHQDSIQQYDDDPGFDPHYEGRSHIDVR